MSDQGIGASVKRKEDDRFLRGRGQFVGDIRLAGMKDVAFVRSPLAHAKLRAVHIPHEQSRQGVRCGRPGRREADRRRVRPSWIQGVRATGARNPEGAPGRRTHRDVRRAHEGRG